MTDAFATAVNLGNILLRRGALTPSQLADAVSKQQEARERGEILLLGQACVQMGFCTQQVLEEALSEQRRILAPACNEGEVDRALRNLGAAVGNATKSSTRLARVTGRTESAFAFTKVRD